jgi:chromosome segregation ATPase
MGSQPMNRRIACAAALVCALAGAALLSGPAFAQTKIVCWKDASGKVIGCGDTVPPEFRSSGTKELDARGVTRRTTDPASEFAHRRALEGEAARASAEESRRQAEQSRLDKALLDTYSSEAEIDLKRDRDLRALDAQIEQLTGALKRAGERQEEAGRRLAAAQKSGNAPPALRSELAQASADRERIEKTIAVREAEKEALRQKFAAYRKRYGELRAAAAAAPPAREAR